jgi:hypothetical protein
MVKRRTRWFFSLVASALAACAGHPGDDAHVQPPWGGGRVLLLGSDQGVTSVQARTGSVLSETEGIPAPGNWSIVFSTSAADDGTVLQATDALTGAVMSSVRLRGALDIRVASFDGSRVALMAPLAEGQSPWIPVPRASTTIVVADPNGGEKPVRYRLEGNYEPEGFSPDGRSLFLISFVPPTRPEAYRVSRLDLSRGRVFPVYTGQKAVVETMSGTRLEQVASPDGRMLFTLYTTQPAAYLATHGHIGRPVAFVHTLSLADGWAHCIALPEEMWGGDPLDQVMALAPGAGAGEELLYVVDTSRDLVTVMDTVGLEVVDRASIDFGPPAGEAWAAVASDGTLFVAIGDRLMGIDPDNLQVTRDWTLEAPITALGAGPDGLYVGMPGAVTVLDPATGHPVGTIPSPATDGVTFLGMEDR